MKRNLALDKEWRELRKARTAAVKALQELEDAKRRRLTTSIKADREIKYVRATREVDQLEEKVQKLREELAGDWAPKVWKAEGASA